MNNKVKFLRGTSDEYAVAEKDSDTIYFTTDDGKLYIGDKEVSGGGSITIDNALSDTSTNPVQNKVVKQAIDNKADKTVATTSADGLMSAEDKGKLDAFEITTTGGKLHDKDIATTDLIPTTLPANGGNADTVDGMHASDFMPINGEVRKYGLIRMNGSDGIRVRHIDGNDTEADGALYLNYNSPNAPIYMNGGNTAIHSGNIGSQSVNYATNAGNANTVGGISNGYYLGTLNAGGGGHGGGFQLSCQHNVFGDNRFVLQIANRTHEVRVDYATDADTLDGLHASDIITSSKPYVTGTAVYSQTSPGQITTNHGFMPSAVIWWYFDDNTVYSARSFNNTQIDLGSTAGSYERSIKYIIFK